MFHLTKYFQKIGKLFSSLSKLWHLRAYNSDTDFCFRNEYINKCLKNETVTVHTNNSKRFEGEKNKKGCFESMARRKFKT